ncbi:ATP-dependent DNA helicase RecQ [Bacillus thermophilus]|uniref:DNA helicase RecQ n=1 Tax=Siminovitchia thermophila TaxID=1245522 RepID=A0ABS2R699_9BACI|nr:DNA helicase RecQ [Siminovitchia thermophila]MBM7714418.1 ATP-dependent DNA helicase RecQ [Siminovitchia thermophila]ONK25039.1 DNA helicase RecQ [Bacillus sp. VT-16-64]
MLLKKAKDLLRSYFGYEQFRQGQDVIIQHVLGGHDTLGIMPTGGGKSVCYQIPSLMLRGITLVISPLISLMKDQVDALEKLGIPSTYINSSISDEEMRERLSGVYHGKFKLIYIAPERLESPSFLRLLRQVHISLIAVDEAHCISQWGHDFRPSYLKIQKLIAGIRPKPVVLALTATATLQVREDIRQLLHIREKHVVVTGFARENLHFHVVKGQDRDLFLMDYLKKNSGQAGIIYAATRKEVERLQRQLAGKGIKAGKYHAGMSETARSQYQEQFLYDDIQVMVATNAFGMGINKSNVRFVIHYNLPGNLEAYYQEAGRAGRDGVDSDCILLFSPQDSHIQSFLIEQSEMDELRKENEYGKLRKMMAYGHTESCLQQYILHYFGEESSVECERCGNCTDDREQIDVTVEAQKVLSCIWRMNEKFGKTMIAKVLTGSSDQKIRSFGFDKLSTYGIMSEKTQKETAELIDFLTAEGYLRPTDGTYPVLMLTEKAADVLRGNQQVKRKEKMSISRVVEDNLLFDALRKLRRDIAASERVPPYIIFSDTTLKEMSAHLPMTEEEMRQIKGVGRKKLEAYGAAFLAEIVRYGQEHGIRAAKRGDTPSHHITYEMWNQGMEIAEIAQVRQLSERTIETHLLKCPGDNLPINWSAFIPEHYEEIIEEAVREAGMERLTPIKELLPEEVSYFMIRAYLEKQKTV